MLSPQAHLIVSPLVEDHEVIWHVLCNVSFRVADLFDI